MLAILLCLWAPAPLPKVEFKSKPPDIRGAWTMQYGTGKGPTWFLGTATQGDYICDWVDGSRWIGKWKLREVHGQYLLHVTECKDGAECKNTWTIHLQPNTLQGIIDNDPKCPFNLQR